MSQTTRSTRLELSTLEARENPANPLGVAADFNLFVLGNGHQAHTDVGGRVAVGGDVSFVGNDFGDSLSNSHGTRDDLIVGGNLSFTNGEVSNGNAVFGGSAQIQNVRLPQGTSRQANVLDFATTGTNLKAWSDHLAGFATNGLLRVGLFGETILTSVSPGTNVFTLPASRLASTRGLTIISPLGGQVIINVTGGSAVQMKNLNMTLVGVSREKVMINMAEATSLTLQNANIQGTILAPRAAANFISGTVNGRLIAGSLTGSGNVANVSSTIDVVAPNLSPAPTGTIGDFVWIDDGDGVQEAGEPGKAGVAVELIDPSGNIVTTLTDANGRYEFTSLAAGTYTVQFRSPDGYIFTTTNVGASTSDSDANSDGYAGTVTLAAGESNSTIDAGLVKRSSISGRVTIQDTDIGLIDVRLYLSGVDVYGNAVELSVLTDENGYFSFGNLDAGTYTLSEQQPYYYDDGADYAGSAGGKWSNDSFSGIVLGAGQDATGYLFTEMEPFVQPNS